MVIQMNNVNTRLGLANDARDLSVVTILRNNQHSSILRFCTERNPIDNEDNVFKDKLRRKEKKKKSNALLIGYKVYMHMYTHTYSQTYKYICTRIHILTHRHISTEVKRKTVSTYVLLTMNHKEHRRRALSTRIGRKQA